MRKQIVVDAGDCIMQTSLSTPGKKVAVRLINPVLAAKHCNLFFEACEICKGPVKLFYIK
jgi:hypothetical protein